MKRLLCILPVVTLASALLMVSCQTVDKVPQPEREELSSMPHNIPASWEGQGGLPGQMGQQY